jgi:signal transduction histidine kinase
MSNKSENILLRILSPMAIAGILLISLSLLAGYWLQKNAIDNSVHQRISGVHRLLQELLWEETKLMNGQIDFLKTEQALLASFLAGDRSGLADKARPFFEKMRSKYRITHFYFHETDKVCFLRVHSPDRYGDLIDRFTMAGAVSGGKPFHGIELGPLGTFTLRVVHPWKKDGKLQGYIELGMEIEHITQLIKQALNLDLLVLIEKKFLKRNDWEAGLIMLNRKGDWDLFDDFVIVDMTIGGTYALNKVLNQHQKDDDSIFSVEMMNRHYKGEFKDLLDAAGRRVGEVISIADVTNQRIYLIRLVLVLSGLSLAIGGGLFLFFYNYIGNIQRQLITAREELKKHRDHLEVLVKERTIELSIAKEKAESANRAKSDFLINVNHELRTPLNSIIGSADLALGQVQSSKMEKIFRTIQRSGRNLIGTVSAIIDFSKSQDGKLELAAIPFRLDEVLRKLPKAFVHKGIQKQIEFRFDIAEDNISNALIGDPDRLTELLCHLLDNTAKFSQGDIPVTIGVSSKNMSADKATLDFYVKDRGIGISPEHLEKIFEPFFQGDTSSTRQHDGTGMGLAMSKRLVELMGGTIRVESEIGKGSTFYFTASFDRQDQEHPFKLPSLKDHECTIVDQVSSKTCLEMGSPELLLELLSTVEPFIQKKKPKPCRETMTEISRYAWPDEYTQEIVELDRLIGKYKFKEAYTIIESIVEKLKSPS